MSVPDTAVSTRPNNVPFVRSAVPADHAAIRDVHVIGVPDARRISVPAYYLGRPAALWLAAFAPRSTTHKITSRVVRQPYGAAGLGQHMR